jgi:hypothetical protein
MDCTSSNCPLVLPVVFLASLLVAAAPPVRCKAGDYYQATLLLFACDGSNGVMQDNQVTTGLTAFASFIEAVPKGTRNLFVTADSETEISLQLLDSSTGWPTGTPYKGVSVMVNNEVAGEDDEGELEEAGLEAHEPSHKELRISGTAPSDLIIKVTNNMGVPATVTIGYVYDSYTYDKVRWLLCGCNFQLENSCWCIATAS